MAKHCVNIKNQQVIDLANELKLHPAITASKIAVWQEIKGLDKFPTIDDLKQSNNLPKIDFKDIIIDNNENVFSPVVDETKSNISNNSEVINELLFNGSNKSLFTASEILRNIINSDILYKTKNGAFFLEKAFNLLNKSGAKVRVISQDSFLDKSEEGVMVFDSINNTIYLSKETINEFPIEFVAESFIHEVTHSTTVRTYFEPKTFEEREFKDLIDKAFEQYKYLGNNNSYGFTNQAEFIAEIYSNPRFRDELSNIEKNNKSNFWKELIDSIRRIFGLTKSSENNKLIESILLFETVEKFSESDNSNWKGTIFTNSKYDIFNKQVDDSLKTQFKTLEDKLNYNIDRMLQSIKLNIDNFEYLVKVIKDDKVVEGFKNQINKLTDLKNTIEQLPANEKILGITQYVNIMNNSMNYVQNRIDKVDYTNFSSVRNTANQMDNYLTSYTVINDVKELLANLSTQEQSLISKEDLSELENLVAESIGRFNLLNDKITALKRKSSKYLINNIKYFPEIESKYRNQLSKEFETNKIPGDKQTWIIDKLQNRDKDLIQADLDQAIEELFENPDIDIYASDVTFSNSINVSNKFIQITRSLLDELDDSRLESERKMDITFKNLFEELVAEKGTNNINKLYENILQQDSNGKHYLKSEYNVKFYTDVHNKINELRRSKKKVRTESFIKFQGIDKNSKEYKDGIKSLKTKTSEIDKQIKSIEEDNFNLNSKGKIISIKDKWKNNNNLSETENKILNFFISVVEQSSKDTYGKQSLITYSYKTKFYELPKITKSDTERLWSGDVKGTLTDKWKDLTTIRPDDVGYFTEERDLNNNPINRLKIHYRGNLSSKDQSLDLFNLFRLEFKNANSYKYRREVESDLNFLLDIVKNNKYYERKGITGVLSKRTGKLNIIEGSESNVHKLMESMLERRLYDIFHKSGSKIGGVELNKAVGTLNSISSFLTLSLNIASGSANVLNGQAQIFLESFIKGHYIKASGVSKANALYTKDLPNILADNINPIRTSFTNQLLDLFNVRGDMTFSESNFMKSDLIKKGLNRESLQVFQDSGEHWIQSTIVMSVLDGVKVLNKVGKFIDKNGKVTTEDKAASVLDMMYKDETGLIQLDNKVVYTTHSRLTPWNEGGKVKVQELIVKKINDSLGNYRQIDQPEIMRHWWGKLIMLYKRYLVPMGQARLRGVETAFTSYDNLSDEDRRYSYALQEYEEGVYTTLIRYLRFSIKNGQKWLLFKENWNRLSDYEKHNIKRSVTEIVLTSILTPLAALLAGSADGDDDEYKYFIAYQMRRMDTELSAYRSPSEMFKMMRSPIPSARLLETSLSILDKTLNPFNWSELDDTYEQGPHKGENKFGVKLQKQLPIVKEVIRSYQDLYKYQDSNWGTGL